MIQTSRHYTNIPYVLDFPPQLWLPSEPVDLFSIYYSSKRKIKKENRAQSINNDDHSGCSYNHSVNTISYDNTGRDRESNSIILSDINNNQDMSRAFGHDELPDTIDTSPENERMDMLTMQQNNVTDDKNSTSNYLLFSSEADVLPSNAPMTARDEHLLRTYSETVKKKENRG